LIALAEPGAWADAACDKLIRELKWCISEKQDVDLASVATAALVNLADERQPNKRKVGDSSINSN